MAARTLNDSFVFGMMIKTAKLTDMIRDIHLQRDVIQPEVMRDTIDQVNRKINFATKGATIRLMQEGRIKLVCNPSVVNLPKYLNVIGLRKPGINKPMFVIDVARFCRGSRDTELTMNARTLSCLMQNALILDVFSDRWEIAASNDNLRKNGAIAYSKLATKILIKLYAVDSDPMKGDLLRFMFAKFYLLNMSGLSLDNKILNENAYAACTAGTSKSAIENLEAGLGSTKEIYENINTLFSAFKKVPGLYSLNLRSFTENWIRMYGEGSAMSIDYLPSFLGMIFSSILLGGLVKDPVVNSICEREIVSAYSAFAKMCM